MTKAEAKRLKKLLSVLDAQNSCTVTLEEVYEDYLSTAAKQRKHETIRGYISHWNNHIGSRFGNTVITDIKHIDVANMHREVGGYVSNRTVAFIGRLYRHAQHCGHVERGHNPAAGVELFRGRSRRRIADGGELERIGRGLRVWGTHNLRSERQFANIIELILLTGARISEISKCKTEWVDLTDGKICLPDSKSGEKDLTLSPPARKVIARAMQAHTEDNNIYLFPSNNRNQYIKSIPYYWAKFKREFGIKKDLRIHDLRRTFASLAISNEVPIERISQLLGHSSVRVTEEVYAHMLDDAKQEAASTVGDVITKAIGEK